MNVLEDSLALHDKLATRYKEYEVTDGEFPSVVVLNEMRYALRATIKLLDQASFDHLSGKKRQEFDASTQELHHALRNAYHDLVDGLLIQLSRMMDALLEKYPVATTNVLGTKRLDILKDLNEVEHLIANSRGDGRNRQELYEVDIYDGWFSRIVEYYRFIDQVAQAEIISEHDRLEQASKSASRKFWLGISLAVLGIVVSVVFGILAFSS